MDTNDQRRNGKPLAETSLLSESADDDLPFPRGQTIRFPYDPPYTQQINFMDTLLTSLAAAASSHVEDSDMVKASLSKGKRCCPVFMLESPTGTGKSLSLACAAVEWLRHMQISDLKDRSNCRKTTACSDDRKPSDLDWLSDWVPPKEREANAIDQAIVDTARRSRTALGEALQKLRRSWEPTEGKQSTTSQSRQTKTRMNVLETRRLHHVSQRHRRKTRKTKPRVALKASDDKRRNDSSFLLDAYHSDEADQQSVESEDGDATTCSPSAGDTPTAKQLLDGATLDGSSAALRFKNSLSVKATTQAHTVAHVQPGTGVRKIVYAARTHSQLSQFIRELRRTAYGDSVRAVHLGGRTQLCTDPEVSRAPEAIAAETCLDRHKDGPACRFLDARDEAVPALALHLQAQPTDVEEAAALGRASETCAYYASRAAVAAADVVVMPYGMLLAATSRKAAGLSLSGCLVVVDEAHNLPEALRSLHATCVSKPVIQAATAQLLSYVKRYADRLGGRNTFYLGQIRRILAGLEKHLSQPPERRCQELMTPTEFLITRKLDNVNIFRILRYMGRSRLSQKLMGFCNHKTATSNSQPASIKKADKTVDLIGLSKHVSAMSIVETFLKKLTSSGSEGKLATDWPKMDESESRSSSRQGIQHPTLRYVLLHPASCFENVLQEAHALALVGGTLRPFVHVAAELLGDHGDILADAAKADAMASCILSQPFYSFTSPRLTAFTCDHVVPPSNVLLQCVGRGPTGIALDFRYQSRCTNEVCDELGQTLAQFCKTAPSGMVVFLPSYAYEAHLMRRWKITGVWRELQSLKRLHREPKSSHQIEAALATFARDAQRKGAILFSVIGGKCSEGINFSNDMARCVVLVGLPYPDITDKELQEKMKSLDGSSNKTITGQSYYQNLCMRAVNQSVGRAIRHASDYAAIVLIDQRYNTDDRIWRGLPGWLTRNERGHSDLPLTTRITDMASFFHGKKNDTNT